MSGGLNQTGIIESMPVIVLQPGDAILDKRWGGILDPRFPPLFRRENASTDTSQRLIRTIASTGKGGFEGPFDEPIDGQWRYVQWKGIGPGNHALRRIQTQRPFVMGNSSRAGNRWAYIPVGSIAQPFPVFSAQETPREGSPVVKWSRLAGASFLHELHVEAVHAVAMRHESRARFRSPKIFGVWKYTRAFCERNGMPMPDLDDPACDQGEPFADYLRRALGCDANHPLLNISEAWDLNSAALGQSIRGLRSIFRVDDVERALIDDVPVEILRTMLEDGARGLGMDFSDFGSADVKRYLERFSEELGRQSAVLAELAVWHGAFHEHKQDITLAAEVCDLDLMVFAKEKRLTEIGEPLRTLLTRQFFLLATHVLPLTEAARHLAVECDAGDLLERLVRTFAASLNKETWGDVAHIVRESPERFTCEAASRLSAQTASNLAGYDLWFDRYASLLREFGGT